MLRQSERKRTEEHIRYQADHAPVITTSMNPSLSMSATLVLLCVS
jgi:hypothetical protein